MRNNNTIYEFDGVAHDQKAPDGPNGGHRYVTDWKFGDERFRVSSVDSEFTTETMIFRIMEDGEINYFDLWTDDDYRTNPSQHANFLKEFLENRVENVNDD